MNENHDNRENHDNHEMRDNRDNEDNARWLMHITGNYGGRVVYWDLTNNNGSSSSLSWSLSLSSLSYHHILIRWHHVATLKHDYKQQHMSMISLRYWTLSRYIDRRISDGSAH